MATVSERLAALRAEIEKGKTEKTRAEANLESLEKQRAEIVAELAGMNVKPEELDAEIGRLETEIEAVLQEAEGLLRGDGEGGGGGRGEAAGARGEAAGEGV